jgi:hypothetical protein
VLKLPVFETAVRFHVEIRKRINSGLASFYPLVV